MNRVPGFFEPKIVAAMKGYDEMLCDVSHRPLSSSFFGITF